MAQRHPAVRRKKKKKKESGAGLVLGLVVLAMIVWLWPRGEAASSGETAADTQGETTGETAAPSTEAYIPQALLELEQRNPETHDFVAHYPGNASWEDIDISGDYTPGEIPHFLQWDERWGYLPYGSSAPEDMIGLSGCGPTALSMVVVGLTGNLEASPAAVARYTAGEGYVTQDSGTDWGLMSQGCRHFGLTAHEVPLWEATMIQELEDSPIICAVGPGDFTEVGHFLVLTGYEDGAFRLQDPNSRENSQRTWTYRELSPQIRGMWAYEGE